MPKLVSYLKLGYICKHRIYCCREGRRPDPSTGITAIKLSNLLLRFYCSQRKHTLWIRAEDDCATIPLNSIER